MKQDLAALRASAIEALGDFLHAAVPQADSLSSQLVQQFAIQAINNAVVFAKKQHDYGPGNIASFGEVGLLVRTSDKIARLKNLMGRGEAKNEAVEDTWLDIANYGSIAQMVRAGLWPGCEAKHSLTYVPPAPSNGMAVAPRTALPLDLPVA